METISNECLRLEVAERGGEMTSLQKKAIGEEYIWQGMGYALLANHLRISYHVKNTGKEILHAAGSI